MENGQMTVAHFEEWLNAMQLEYDGLFPEKLTETVVETETPVMRNVVVKGSDNEDVDATYTTGDGETATMGSGTIQSVQYSYAE
jgi:hypothetical protein